MEKRIEVPLNQCPRCESFHSAGEELCFTCRMIQAGKTLRCSKCGDEQISPDGIEAHETADDVAAWTRGESLPPWAYYGVE